MALPNYLYEFIELYRQSNQSYNLRTNDLQFKIPHVRSYMESFLPSTVKQWNILPDYIRNVSGISLFRSLLNPFFVKRLLTL